MPYVAESLFITERSSVARYLFMDLYAEVTSVRRRMLAERQRALGAVGEPEG